MGHRVRQLLCLFSGIMCLFVPPAQAEPEKVAISIGEWPPYVSSELPFLGLMSHIVDAAFELERISPDYEFTDWESAYQDVMSGNGKVSFGWIKDQKREAEVLFSESIAYLTLSFFHHRSKPFSWETYDDLTGLRIGVIKGYSYGDEFELARKKGLLTITEYDSAEKAFTALIRQQLDLLPSDIVVGESVIARLPQFGDVLVYDEHPLSVTPTYLIAAKDNEAGQAIIARFNQGLNELKSTGRYEKIIRSFHLVNQIDRLVFLTEHNPPLNYLDQGEVKGISVAVMKALLSEVESSITPERFQIQPWARAYRTLQNDDNTVLFSIVKTPERSDQFQWVGPIYRSNVVVFASDKPTQKLNDLSALKNDMICAVNEDVGAQLLRSMGHPEDKTHLVPSPEQCAKMLAVGRLNYWAFGSDTGRMQFNAIEQKHSEDYHEVLALHESFRYIAFSREVPPAIIATFQESLDYLKLSGKLQQIIDAQMEAAMSH